MTDVKHPVCRPPSSHFCFLHSKRQRCRADAPPRGCLTCVSLCVRVRASLELHVTAHQYQGEEGLSSCAVIGGRARGIDLMSAMLSLLLRCAVASVVVSGEVSRKDAGKVLHTPPHPLPRRTKSVSPVHAFFYFYVLRAINLLARHAC